MIAGSAGGFYISRVFAENFHPYSARALWWNGKFVYGSYAARAVIPPERRRAVLRQLAAVGIRSESQLFRMRQHVAEALAENRHRPGADKVVFFPLLPGEGF